MLTFFPYLFDSQDAWEQTIADINYRYDMTLDEFMIIYGKYRNIMINQCQSTHQMHLQQKHILF